MWMPQCAAITHTNIRPCSDLGLESTTFRTQVVHLTAAQNICIRFSQNPSTSSGDIAINNFTRDLDLTLTLGLHELHDVNMSYSHDKLFLLCTQILL